MSITLPADTGAPLSQTLVARPEVRWLDFKHETRQVSLRNTGTNTLWISLDEVHWIDVACGTSWDDRVMIKGLRYCTQVGRTQFVVVAVALMNP